jgi:N-acetylneuraminic acid mutarotase
MMLRIRLLIIIFLSILLNCCTKNNDIERNGAPVIYFFTPDADTVGASVKIFGRNFDPNPVNNFIYFGNMKTTAFHVTKDTKNIDTLRIDTLLVNVPNGAVTNRIKLEINSNSIISKDTFFVLTGRWKQKKSCNGARFEAFSFMLNNKGFIGTGLGNEFLSDFWEYDPSSNIWSKKADFLGGKRRRAVSFEIDGKGYVGLGSNAFNEPNDFYEYNPMDDSWTKLGDFPVYLYNDAVGLSINGKGYCISGDFSNQVWEYDPATDQWKRKKDFPGLSRSYASGFVIGKKGYLGIGDHGGDPKLTDLWEYEPIQDNWVQKSNLPKYIGTGAVGFSIDGKGYFGNGNMCSFLIFEYDPNTDKWVRKTNFPGASLGHAVSFMSNHKAYIATGVKNNDVSDELWEFEP